MMKNMPINIKHPKFTASQVAYRTIGYIVMIIVVAISLVPFLWAFLSSFKTNAQILNSALTLPTSFNLSGYFVALEIASIPSRFVNSVYISTVSTAISLMLYGMAAYAFARFNFKFKNVLFSLLICSILIPANAMIQPIYATINFLGLYDTKTALILVYTAFRMPLCLFIMRSFFLTLPRAVEESAYIEGAGFFTTFIKIVLPMSKSAVACAAVLSFIDSWNELLYAMLLTSSESNRTLPLAMKFFTSMFSFNYTAMFAAMVLCMIPTIIAYVFLQEQIMECMVAGSIKG
jgi:raffinose/stachyose/melibiose transport system permease protein